MYTEIVKIFEAGLSGDTEKVKSYGEHFVRVYGSNVPALNVLIEEKLAKKFNEILKGEKGDPVTLD